MAKFIEITVFPDGKTSVETTGFSGKECQAASLPYERALGQRLSETMTAESRVPPVQDKLKIQQKLG